MLKTSKVTVIIIDTHKAAIITNTTGTHTHLIYNKNKTDKIYKSTKFTSVVQISDLLLTADIVLVLMSQGLTTARNIDAIARDKTR